MDRITGITVNDISAIEKTCKAISLLGARPVVRVTLDPSMNLSYYDWRVRKLYMISDVMIQFATASDLNHRKYRGFWDWKHFVDTAFQLFLGYAKYWEIAHNPNQSEAVIGRGAYEKADYALEVCKRRGQTTAATYLIGNANRAKKGSFFLDWIVEHRLQTDLVFGSCYPFRCNPEMPQSSVNTPGAIKKFIDETIPDLHHLSALFPDAKGIGWGEFGVENEYLKSVPFSTRTELCKQFYGSEISLPNYIGGGFYPEFVKDCARNPELSSGILTSIKLSMMIDSEKRRMANG